MPTNLFNIELVLDGYSRQLDLSKGSPLILTGDSRNELYISNKGGIIKQPMVNTWIVKFGKTRFIEDCTIVKVLAVHNDEILVSNSLVCSNFKQILHYCIAIRNNRKGKEIWL